MLYILLVLLPSPTCFLFFLLFSFCFLFTFLSFLMICTLHSFQLFFCALHTSVNSSFLSFCRLLCSTSFPVLLLCSTHFLFFLLCSTTYIIILHFLPFSSVLHVHEGIYRVSVIAESYFRQSAKLAKLFTHLTQVFFIMTAERDSGKIFMWR